MNSEEIVRALSEHRLKRDPDAKFYRDRAEANGIDRWLIPRAPDAISYFHRKQLAEAELKTQDLSAVIPAADVNDPDLDPADIASWEHYRHNAPILTKEAWRV